MRSVHWLLSLWRRPGGDWANTCLMPMEIFVSCVGDMASLGGSVGRGLGPATPLVRFLFFFCCCCPRGVGGMESFTLAAPFRCVRVEFLRCGDGSKTRGRLAVWTNTRLQRKCIAGLFGVSFWLWITYYGLQSTVYVNLPPWTGYLPMV